MGTTSDVPQDHVTGVRVSASKLPKFQNGGESGQPKLGVCTSVLTIL